jgi:CRP-like cAMP-binding protein
MVKSEFREQDPLPDRAREAACLGFAEPASFRGATKTFLLATRARASVAAGADENEPGESFAFTCAPPPGMRLRPMSPLLDFVATHPTRQVPAAGIAIEQGEQTGELLVLVSGEVEVLRDGVRVAKAAEPGVVFGEMSALLGGPATATVRALTPAVFAVIAEPREFLVAHPEVSLYVAELLARRLDALNKYLIDVKRQYEGHDHLGMVDEVIEALMHRPPRRAES